MLQLQKNSKADNDDDFIITLRSPVEPDLSSLGVLKNDQRICDMEEEIKDLKGKVAVLQTKYEMMLTKFNEISEQGHLSTSLFSPDPINTIVSTVDNATVTEVVPRTSTHPSTHTSASPTTLLPDDYSEYLAGSPPLLPEPLHFITNQMSNIENIPPPDSGFQPITPISGFQPTTPMSNIGNIPPQISGFQPTTPMSNIGNIPPPISGFQPTTPTMASFPVHLNNDYSPGFLVSTRAVSCSRGNFAANLNRTWFSVEERLTSNVRGKNKKKQLSPQRMRRIYDATFQMYPMSSKENEKDAWAECIKAIDSSNRQLKRKIICINKFFNFHFSLIFFKSIIHLKININIIIIDYLNLNT